MDALDRLAGIGTDLLHRVDAVLVAGGAPAGDPLWPLLRLVGALPGDALEFGLKLTPEPLREAASQLRADADRFARRRARLTADLTVDLTGVWEGSGADGFAVRWQSLAGHIGDGGDPATIAGRLRATASYADALAGWAEGLRGELAEAVARVAGSTEAVTIRHNPISADPTGGGLISGDPFGGGAGGGAAGGWGVDSGGGGGAGGAGGGPPSAVVLEAAARIGVRVLQPVADAFDAVRDLETRWSPDLSELRYTEPGILPAGSATPITRVSL